jgi:hypothetical protein
MGEQQKIADKYKLKLVDNHNLGVVPSLFIPNLPVKNMFGNMIFEWYPDTKPSGDDLQGAQQHLNHIIDAISWELEYNRTAIMIRTNPADMEEMKKNPELFFQTRCNQAIISLTPTLVKVLLLILKIPRYLQSKRFKGLQF